MQQDSWREQLEQMAMLDEVGAERSSSAAIAEAERLYDEADTKEAWTESPIWTAFVSPLYQALSNLDVLIEAKVIEREAGEQAQLHLMKALHQAVHAIENLHAIIEIGPIDCTCEEGDCGNA